MKISELLQEAKNLYLKCIEGKDVVKFPGMCWCIKTIANRGKSREEQREKGHIPYAAIKAQIPEFNPRYLKASRAEYLAIRQHLNEGLEFWWDIDATHCRIKAFDELIEIYKDSDKEFIW